MPYTTASAATKQSMSREPAHLAAYTRSATGQAVIQPLPFVFGLRRRAGALKENCRMMNDIDPAVSSYATD